MAVTYRARPIKTYIYSLVSTNNNPDSLLSKYFVLASLHLLVSLPIYSVMGLFRLFFMDDFSIQKRISSVTKNSILRDLFTLNLYSLFIKIAYFPVIIFYIFTNTLVSLKSNLVLLKANFSEWWSPNYRLSTSDDFSGAGQPESHYVSAAEYLAAHSDEDDAYSAVHSDEEMAASRGRQF